MSKLSNGNPKRDPKTGRYSRWIPSCDDIAERLWKDTKFVGDCLEYTKRANVNTYGQFRIRKKTKLATRIAWQLVYGPIASGLFVCHKCDNPRCVRPDHLFLGTRQDNADDAATKNRLPFGEQHWNVKLTSADIREFRRRWNDNEKRQTLADEYGICLAHAARIANFQARAKDGL